MSNVPMLTFIGLLVLCPVTLSCQHQDRGGQHGSSDTKTDLGESGNATVAERFAEYRAKRAIDQSGCRANGSGKRVMVTGFGLFTGVPYNISGLVTRTFADPVFTPDDLGLTGSDAIGLSGDVSLGLVPESAKGAVTTVRSMTIKGTEYEICFIGLDVLWDLAAAIIVLEAESFQPALILMSGRGGGQATYEGGALNDAAIGMSGFESNGAEHGDNAPIETPILPGRPYKSLMTWNNVKIHAATRSMISDIGFQSHYETGPRPSNNYICNNVSYVVLEAIQGAEVNLAGGMLRWTPVITSAPRAGFFHYPSTASNDRAQVTQWIRVMAAAIATELE